MYKKVLLFPTRNHRLLFSLLAKTPKGDKSPLVPDKTSNRQFLSSHCDEGIGSASGVPTRCRRRRKERGTSPLVAFSRQTVGGSLRDKALIFCFVLHQGKMKNKPKGALVIF